MLALDIKNLSKIYKNGYPALKNINLELEKGKFLALLGKNGAGKTTFVEILSGLTQKTDGKVLIKNKNLDEYSELVKSYIGIVPQEFNLSIFENIIQILINQAGYFGITKDIAVKRAKQLLIDLDLWEKKDNIVLNLSGGMKRRLMVARALIHDPEIIFFDEPTAGVDVQVRRKIWDIMKNLNKQGKTIILTTHYFEEAEKLCDTLAIIANGEIIKHGSLRSILSKYHSKKYLVEIDSEKKINIEDRNIAYVSSKMLEVTVTKQTSLNDSIKAIVSRNMKIKNVQPRNTRLEELFLEITG